MNKITPVKELKVFIDFGGDGDVKFVGRLAVHDHKVYFEYTRDFIDSGMEISPFNLPLKLGLSVFDSLLFEGLPGVFNDSLPDGWGRLLFDRFVRSRGLLPSSLTPLDRLAYVGHYGLGALVFEPDYSIDENNDSISLDALSQQAQSVLNGTSDDVLAELIALNGSSAGARPKALIGINNDMEKIIHGTGDLPDDYTPWMVKFPNGQDGTDAGAIEYVYALMAKDAGIQMPDVYLFSAKKGAGYFAIKRFDRDGKKRFHMHTACGILHSDFRTPSLDYEDLLALTMAITRDVREVEKMYRLAVFNVLAHNRDDHGKNFTFLMDGSGSWGLSPAYDLTFSSGPRGEQSMMVMGEGVIPGKEHLIKLGKGAGIAKPRIDSIIDQTKSSLANWSKLAKQHGVIGTNIKLIGYKIG